MSSWMNEAAAVQNHNGNGFPHMNDPNNLGGGGGAGAGAGAMMDPSAFMANNGTFNPAAAGQFANAQQMAAAMQNGPMRNASPSFSNPVYQTNPVIPSKRPRPREDSMGASPRQNPGMLPTSRSDTPQQGQFPGGFQPNAMPQQNPGQPGHYPHLQPNGSANASPSPVMAGNQLRPGSVPQRVNTASPHPFSPASQQFASQASPVPSEHGGTPQPNPYMQNQNFPQGFNPNYAQSPSPARPPSGQNAMPPQMMQQQMGQVPQQMSQMHPSQMFNPQQMQQMQQMQAQGRGGLEQQKMLYQMRLQQQMQQQGIPPGNMQQMVAAQMQAQNMAQQGRGMMPKQPMPMANGQMPPGGMRQAPPMPRGLNPEHFLKNLTTFMNARQLPLDPNPIIEGRPLNLLQLFQNVSKFGGYRTVSTSNMWAQVAASVGFNPQQVPSAPGQVKANYERNLLEFEKTWAAQRSQQMKQQMGGHMQGSPAAAAAQRMGPQGQMPQPQPMQPGQQPPQTPVKQMTPGMQQASMNGMPVPQHPQMGQAQPPPGQGHLRSHNSRSVDSTSMQGDFPMPSPAPSAKSATVPAQPPHAHADRAIPNGVSKEPAGDPEEYVPCHRELHPSVIRRREPHPSMLQDWDESEEYGNYGGYDLWSLSKLGHDLEAWRPDVPPAHELGNIDIHALTKSLQCGIHGEVRLALDTLGSVTRVAESAPPLMINLNMCEDLVESLIDCAEEQVDLLVERAVLISDDIDLNSYEEVIRACRLDQSKLLKIPRFGDSEYELEHAADRLIAIATILRNLSFLEPNQPALADEVVVKFLCGAIRSLGTHENLLRSPKNMLDFMKDLIIILSNIAGAIELPGKEQALCFLQFLLAFAPSPVATLTGGKVVFTPYEPALHPYLPHAIDALAKLFARDEPNRTHYKTIFAVDGAATPPYELLTKTFGLAIACIPDQNKESRPANLPNFVEARKPILMQGLLAADIIASLAPGYETGVTRAWLSSAEGFAQNLFRLVRTLCSHAEPQAVRPPTSRAPQPKEDPDLLYIITCGVSTLKRLSEKARDPSKETSIPPNALPHRESLFGALTSLKSPKWAHLLAQLSAYAGLED